jgi:hypothetical protein
MGIPRLHLFELEDQSWFPATIRDLATDYLHFVEKRFSLHRPAVELVAETLRASQATHIVDLCSGGGGPIPPLLEELAALGLSPTAMLTDRFPNAAAFQQASSASTGRISFLAQPVDARAVPADLKGMRTMFNAFHHFNPRDATNVLHDAVKARQPIGIFEASDRKWHTLIPMLLLTPSMVMIMTLFMRPFHCRRLLWTYVLPLVPLTCWWDGVVSLLRSYSPAELQGMAEAAGAKEYCWRAGQVPIGTVPGNLTYLIGWPVDDQNKRAV